MPLPWNIQGQVGQSSEKSDLTEDVPDRWRTQWLLEALPSQIIQWFHESLLLQNWDLSRIWPLFTIPYRLNAYLKIDKLLSTSDLCPENLDLYFLYFSDKQNHFNIKA